MQRIAIGGLRVLARAVGYGLLGASTVLLVVFVLFVNAKPDLSVWHTAELDEEFTADAPVADFEAYLALEDRLFDQLDARVRDRIAPEERTRLNRFHRGSLADPERWPRDWNRSYELPVASPRAGALLIHGMSDSPYSLRHVAERLHAAGVHVVGLRVPGHGTAPVGLTRVRWQDMAAAVALAMRHLAEEVGDRPRVLVGYSNGGALSVHYALMSLTDPSRPRVDRVVLLSPEIGVTPAAAFAIWQDRIGRLLGLEKLAWNSVLPEYDPFKYQSFAVNAGDQAHRITAEIARLIAEQGAAGRLADMPPVLAFQSAVDAPVSPPAVIEGLMAKLPPGGHELVLFDLNRRAGIESVIRRDPRDELLALLRRSEPSFTLRVVTNGDGPSEGVVVRTRPPGSTVIEDEPLALTWPRDVYSLSHVALPFPPEDPLYGDERAGPSPGIRLGRVALRGERGVLQVSADDMLRERSNPFYPYLEQRLLAFVGLDDAGAEDPSAPAD